MKDVLEYGKRILISTVFALTVLTIVFILIEWKNISNGLYTCSICNEGIWLFPKKVTILGQDLYVCRTCVRNIREVGHQFASLFG